MTMEHLWNDIEERQWNYSKKNVPECRFFHHKSFIDRPGVKPRPPQREADDEAPQPCANACCCRPPTSFRANVSRSIIIQVGACAVVLETCVTLCALSMLANIRLTSTIVFLAVNSDLICNIRRDMKYLSKQHTCNLQPHCIPDKFLAPQLFCREFACP